MPSKHFAYLFTRKSGTKWQLVNSVKGTGSFSGWHTMIVKRVFGGKAIRVGNYHLKLSTDSGACQLSFRVAAL